MDSPYFLLEPLKPVSQRARIVLGAAFFVLFFGAWALATFGGWIDAMFLKDPLYTLRTGVELFSGRDSIRPSAVV